MDKEGVNEENMFCEVNTTILIGISVIKHSFKSGLVEVELIIQIFSQLIYL